MEEISIKIEVPEEFKEEFKIALSEAMKELVNNIEFSIAKGIVSKSKFTEKDADELSEKIKKSMHTDLVKRGLI